MRTLRLPLTGAVILMLLGGLAVTAVARSDGSTRVTGSVLGVGGDQSAGEYTEEGVVGEDWVGHVRGQRPVVEIEWSDPRLPSEARMVGNYDAYGTETDGDVGVVVLTNTWLLEDADGSWTGPWIGWCDEAWLCYGTVTLTGHGAYEGFHAVLTERPQEEADGAVTKVLEGAILAGEMTPIPEPLEPTTE
jgi:hypothetical protein